MANIKLQKQISSFAKKKGGADETTTTTSNNADTSTITVGDMSMEELNKLVGKSVTSYANAFVDAIGEAFEKEIENSFTEPDNNGHTIESHYIDKITSLIQDMDEDSVEHHLNHMKPKYTAKIKNKKPKHGGKNKTRKRKQKGGVDMISRAVSNFLYEPKLRIKNAIENKLLDHVFTDVIENAFYRASYRFSLEETDENELKKTRDKIVKNMFGNYDDIKDAILKERCNPKNRSKSRNKCNS
jgi:hypothetical protein